MTQVVEYLPSKCKILSSNSSNTKRRRRRRKRRRMRRRRRKKKKKKKKNEKKKNKKKLAKCKEENENSLQKLFPLVTPCSTTHQCSKELASNKTKL
jgi:DNA invertase Pin-like site-specific DNA recombinase